MITVATGGPKIATVQAEYAERRRKIAESLRDLGLQDPNPHSDLWQWYAKWSTDLPSYAKRRTYIAGIYQPLLDQLSCLNRPMAGLPSVTGWERVDRILSQLPIAIEQSKNEEDFQAIGHKCREVMISAAQHVYRDSMEIHLDTKPSTADSKRMFEGFLIEYLRGESSKLARKVCKSAVDLANELTHRRSASRFDACICFESTRAAIAIVHCIHKHIESMPESVLGGNDAPF